MGWAIRTVRTVVLVVAIAASLLAFESPASALPRSIDGIVVAPVMVQGYRSVVMDGVVVDPTFGLLQFHWSDYTVGSCTVAHLSLTALDGSQLLATSEQCLIGIVIIPLVLVARTYPITVTGGTGQFANATGDGQFDLTRTSSLAPVALPVSPGVVGYGPITLDFSTS